MQEQTGRETFVKEIQNRTADVQIQIEGAVHKFELPHPAIQ